ncbi:batten's disease protein Cln3 [Kockovaella imperatae]|uniref:Protein BTN n=1 Tax=Kockovaella imperatae TaxID=4999 RepID=A0A1Y1UNP7_9TREE|nr:batten's disease protein Cln3 [Kockovaella imperatae]ORX39157.1 batten's disease protein Cln3 [Kockovaella imperatae]
MKELNEHETAHDAPSAWQRAAWTRLFVSFMTFGLLNNVLYVIILSAALDLVPSTTPKGVVAFFNIFPALLAKVFWPILSRGTIRYARRVCLCTVCSWLGIAIIAFSSSVKPRLFGISLASLSSGLGELTFLQLSTTLPTPSSSRTALGAWSSGTGFAGIAGAGLWWLLRGLGVKGGLGLSSLLPLFFPLTYFVLLPSFSLLDEDAGAVYQPVPTDVGDSESTVSTYQPSEHPATSSSKKHKIQLTTMDKINLIKPLVLRFMLPLCIVYIEEYVINSGVAPTLVFPLPTTGLWSILFKSARDYYPFWSLTYQTFVFISRSSLSLGLPPLPRRLLPLPAIVQCGVLSLLSLQASKFVFSSPEYTPPAVPPLQGSDRTISFVFVLICLEGLCGGAAYVNTFYHVGREGEDGGEGLQGIRQKMEKEFRIGATGASDSLGILFASLISMPFELALCDAQVARGRTTCRDL